MPSVGIKQSNNTNSLHPLIYQQNFIEFLKNILFFKDMGGYCVLVISKEKTYIMMSKMMDSKYYNFFKYFSQYQTFVTDISKSIIM